MIWNQSYFPFGLGLGVSVVIAAVPIFTLLLLLGVMRKAAWVAGLWGLGVTFLLAIVVYRMPAITAVSAAANGAAFGLFPISWIVFWAIALFRVTEVTGKFEVIKDSIARLTADPRRQALLIGFGFGAFLEGAAGFGTPVAIAATMLTGLGFSPFRASAICLLANTAPVAFGSIGIPLVTLAGTTALPLEKLSGAVGRLCAPISLLLPAYIIAATWGFGSVAEQWLPVGLAGVTFAGLQFLVSNFIGPQLTDIISAVSAMAVLVVSFRLWPAKGGDSRGSSDEGAGVFGSGRMDPGSTSSLEDAAENGRVRYSVGQIAYAWLPYFLLVACVSLWGYKPVQGLLNSASVAIPWPLLHDMVRRMPPIVATPSPYHAIFNLNWFSAAGTSCMLATLLSALCLRLSLRKFIHLLFGVTRQLLLPTGTVALVLAIAFLMNYCGATATLGLGFAAAGAAFPFCSALLGWLGVFLTGSDTSSNALFGNLQVVTAGKLGLDPVLMAAANSAGGVMGKMISLQTIAVAAAATGISVADQARLFRFTLKHSLLLVSLVGLLALLYSYA
jgi:L-lactate transport